jgi:hypothetical protein
MNWRTGEVESVIEVGTAGELQRRRNDHDNGDVFYSIWFYPRPAAHGEGYSPAPFYYVAWARVAADYGGGPIAITLHHNVADMTGMRRSLPSLSVPDIEEIAPALEFLGRAFAAAFDGRRPRAV